MNRVKTLLLTVTTLLLVSSLFAGQEVIPYRGEVKEGPNHSQMTRDTDVIMTNVDGITLNSNFGGWTKDYFMEYYVPAADGYVNSITFNMSDLPDVTGGGMAIWVYEANYPWPELNSEAIADACGDAQLGYYDESTGYENVGTNWVRGGINDVAGALDVDYDPLGAQIWPEFGAGSISIEPNADDEGFITADLVVLDGEPAYFERGVPIIVVVKFTGFPEGGDATEYRMGFLSGTKHIDPQPTMKFYSTISSPTGRCGDDDWGWYIRSFVWDWDLNATLTGDRGPVVAMDALITTLSTDAQLVTATITDDNPSGGAAGVASASLYYTINGGDAVEVAMTGSGDEFSASIPGQAPGTEITHWVMATDVGGISSTSEPNTYSIFEATEPLLLVFDDVNAYSGGYEWYYYATLADTFANHFDMWEPKFGPVSSELVNNYELVYHVMGGGPYNDATDVGAVYADWLAMGTEAAPRRLFLTGQDYGVISGFADTTFPASAFENMYLGVETLGPQDINYDGTVASYELPYAINAVENDPTTGHLFSYAADSLQMFYEPNYENNFANWIDNLTPSTGTVCFTDPNNADAAVAVYNSGAGWKTAFWTVDPVSINFYSPADTASMYHWGLNANGGTVTPTFEWFGVPNYSTVGIEDVEVAVPTASKLHASYPNPFNPVTNIAYELGNAADVNITVYNMLGQEVATLVAGFQTAGAYTVQWNGIDHAGHSVPSGLYFYTMQTEGFSATQKMMLLK
jgi:hypothetical protein